MVSEADCSCVCESVSTEIKQGRETALNVSVTNSLMAVGDVSCSSCSATPPPPNIDWKFQDEEPEKPT